jgi:hypothetical protein
VAYPPAVARIAACALVLAALVAGSAEGDARSATSRTQLFVRVWPEGRGEEGTARIGLLRCRPAGGTIQGSSRVCRRLAALARPFAPVPADTICAQVYGGPAEAFVDGRYEGRRVWSRFDRRDACRTARWNRLAFLFAAVR